MDENMKAEFVNQYHLVHNKLFLIALSILHHPQNAEDALQNAAIKAYLKFSSLRDDSLFSTWITRIVMNECYTLARKMKQTIPIDESKLTAQIQFNETEWEVFKRLSELPKKVQSILLLRYYHEMPLKDIAKTLSIPQSTVKSRLYRALAQLEKDWSDLNEQFG